MQDRYQTLLQSIELERKAEEKYYRSIATAKTTAEKVDAGILLSSLSLEQRYYTVGEYIELKLTRPESQRGPHKFKVGVGCQLIVKDEELRTYRGTISYRRKNEIGILLKHDNLTLHDFPLSISYQIEMVYDERPYKIMTAAVERVMKSKEPHIVELREGIRTKSTFPTEMGDNPQRWSLPPTLNSSQKAAIEHVLKSEYMGIIHGPPGTGKTTTLVGLVQTLLQKERKILVCGPSNNSVDLLASKIHELGIKVVRIGNVTRINDDVAHLTLDEQARNHPEWGHIKKVKIESEEARRMAGQRKRSFGQEERRNRNDMYKEARELKKWARDLEERLIGSLIDSSQVVATTLIGLSNKHMEDLRFSTVIIDEASQALEPECWNAILQAHRVIFAGDHMQLSPTVKSPEAAELGLTETLLDRMTAKLLHKQLLTTQYRMNDAILAFSNKRWYNGQLNSDPSVASHVLPGEGPVVTLIDTSGCGFEEVLDDRSRSLRNEGEYFILREHVLGELSRYKGCSIGVISPYAEQIRYLTQEISDDEELRALDITVNTIDGFQGQERDAILLSLVRSNDAGIIGFLADERRLNVALTRAKKRLVVIGDVATLSASPLYLDLVDHVEKEAEYKSAWEYMS